MPSVMPKADLGHASSERKLHHRGRYCSFEAVEYATLERVDWFNNRRLLEPIRNSASVATVASIYTALETEQMAA